MQLILLFILSAMASAVTVYGTQLFLASPRSKKQNLVLLLTGILNGCIFSVIADFVIKGGRPDFYFHTHRPGTATLRIFGSAVICGSAFYGLMLMIFERKKEKNTVFRWLVRSSLIALCSAVFLEIGYFNFRHFELIGSGAPELHYDHAAVLPHGMYFNRASWKFHPYNRPLEPGIETFIGYKKVRNITYHFDDGSERSVLRLNYNDQTHRNYMRIPDRVLIKGIPRSYNIPMHTVGVTYSILMSLPEIIAPGDSYGISLDAVDVNTVVPLEILPVRFILCFLAVFLFSAFFPGSPLWYTPLNFRNIFQMCSIAVLIILISGFCYWTVISSYTGSDLSITEQKAALNENYQQYNKLVDALMVPRYALLDNPHHYLEKDGDPYDMQLRERRQYDYLWDTAYYNKQYFVYFGVVPAVAVLLPYKMITGLDLDLDYPILGFSIIFIIGIYGVYSQIIKRWFKNISFALYWNGLLLILTSLNLTWCLRRTLVYELAITSGICFAVWGIFFILLTGKESPLRFVYFFLSGACTALSVGCRPTQVFISLIVFTLAFLQFRATGKILTKRNIISIILFIIPYAAAALALMKYNYERFDDPFEFGITYQLTTENRAAGLPLLGFYGRLLSMLSSFFTLPVLSMEFPFIHLQNPVLSYNGIIINSDRILGVFAYPVMAFLVFLPVMRKQMENHSSILFRFCISCLVTGIAISIVSADFAITNRYLTDYLYLASLPAVFCLFCIYERFESGHLERAAQLGVVICAVIGISLFIVLSLTGEENWFQRINPLYYDKLRYWTSPWL